MPKTTYIYIYITRFTQLLAQERSLVEFRKVNQFDLSTNMSLGLGKQVGLG